MNIKIKNVNFTGIFSGFLGYNDTLKYKMGGFDLGFPLYDSKSKELYLLFGDSFSENNFDHDWRSNTMVKIDKLTKDGKILIDHFLNKDGIAYSLSNGHHENTFEMTRIPTGAIEINSVYYFYYFSICSWDYKDDFKMNLGGLVKSSDKGKTWQKVNEVVFLNDLEKESAKKIAFEDNQNNKIEGLNFDLNKHLNHSFTQIFPKAKGKYVYLFAEGGFRNNPLRLGRVKKEFIENYDEYEYLIEYKNSKPVFKKGLKAIEAMHNKKTAVICKANSGEMSLIFNPFLKKYCLFMVVTKPNNFIKTSGLYVFFSDKIYGPYDDYIKVADYLDRSLNITKMYAPMTNEKLIKNKGKDVYLLLSQWIPLYNPLTIHIEFNKE